MAFIKYPDYEKEISNSTPSGPHCGYRFFTASPAIALTVGR